MASGSRENEENTSNFLLLVEHGTVENCKRYVQKFPDAIKGQNQKGETALHIAAGNPNQYAKMRMLLDEGADVNARNYWGQTPLHYAACARSAEMIHYLLHEANIDVCCKDANGYTALHYSAISTQNIDSKWGKCLNFFIEAGIDINSSTNCGQSILHQTAKLYEGLYFLIHILRNYPEVDICSVDMEGKNFLHIFNEFDSAQILNIVEVIAQCQHKDKLKTLLNQKNFAGITILMKILNHSFMSKKGLDKLVTSYGANLHCTDNLLNTALHMLSSKSGTEQTCRYIEMLIKLGIDVNSKNIFGQTALSLLGYKEILDVFLKYSFDYKTCDRWNRTPFLEIMCRDPFPSILEMMLENHETYIDKQDKFDSAPLHFAAYIGDVKKVKLLLKYTKRKLVKDKMNDIPSDTALRHGHLECYQHLIEGTSASEHRNRNILLYKAPRFVNASVLKGQNDIRKLLKYFPKDMIKYSDQLLLTKHITNIQRPENIEDSDIISAVKNLVSRICDHVKSYDSRFEISVFQTGSTAEGTKAGQPDEFDFALCIEKLSENCDIVTPAKLGHSQYVCLRFKENAVSEYISFSDENRFFIALPFLNYLLVYLSRALKEPDLWVSGNLFMRPNNGICPLIGKPVFNFNMYWNGSKYKQLAISIDLVPVVYTRGWWPSFIPTDKIKLMTDDVKDAGCFVLLQTKIKDSASCWYTMNDNINTTCKRNETSEFDGKQSEIPDHLLQRVSVAPAEIALMKSLPEPFRKAYALAKIVKGKELCPDVNLDDIPLFFDRTSNNRFFPSIKSPSEEIKSYWLKNCTFYVTEEIASTACEGMAPLDITILIYEKLIELVSSCQLNAYLFPLSDVLANEKDEALSTNEVHKLLLTRKVCIDTVLGILGRPFPDDNGEWIRKRETKYRQYNPTDDEMSSRYMKAV